MGLLWWRSFLTQTSSELHFVLLLKGYILTMGALKKTFKL